METTLTIALVILVVILLAFSAFFSGSETAYTGSSLVRLKSMDPDCKNRKVQRAIANYEQFDRLLTTLLVGNNIVNIASSTICTLLMTEWLGSTWGTVGATVLMITVLLIAGEITPKTLAKRNPEKYAVSFSGAIHLCMRALRFITSFFFHITRGIAKVAGASEDQQPITEGELSVMIDEIQQEGTLEKDESELIKSAMEFDDTIVSEICIPRVDVIAVSNVTDPEKLKDLFIKTEFSRIPVYEGDIDRIVGTVFFKDFFMKYSVDPHVNVADIIRPVKFVPKEASIDRVMRELQKAKLHMAVVLDEYGGTYGLVTMEDILEELVGDIWDESDVVKQTYVKESDDQYMVLGDANIFDITDTLGIRFDPGDYDSVTVGGYIGYRLEKVPSVGDRVDCPHMSLIVRSIRSRRVKEVTLLIRENEMDGPEDDVTPEEEAS